MRKLSRPKLIQSSLQEQKMTNAAPATESNEINIQEQSSVSRAAKSLIRQ